MSLAVKIEGDVGSLPRSTPQHRQHRIYRENTPSDLFVLQRVSVGVVQYSVVQIYDIIVIFCKKNIQTRLLCIPVAKATKTKEKNRNSFIVGNVPQYRQMDERDSSHRATKLFVFWGLARARYFFEKLFF